METNATKRTDIFQIDPRNIVVMDDFNARRDFDLEELKEQIKAKGVLNPITVLPFKDEDGIEGTSWWMVKDAIGLLCLRLKRVQTFLTLRL